MNWSPGVGIEATVGLTVGYKEPVSLRSSRDSGAYLAIGDGVEIILAQSHVATLHEQSAAVLGDMVALEQAEDQVVTAQVVGEQAATTADYARAQAEVALAVGAEREALAARTAAERATDAAIAVQAAVRAVLDAMRIAEEATETAGEAAAAAAHVVRETTDDDAPTSDGDGPDGQAGRTRRLV